MNKAVTIKFKSDLPEKELMEKLGFTGEHTLKEWGNVWETGSSWLGQRVERTMFEAPTREQLETFLRCDCRDGRVCEVHRVKP